MYGFGDWKEGKGFHVRSVSPTHVRSGPWIEKASIGVLGSLCKIRPFRTRENHRFCVWMDLLRRVVSGDWKNVRNWSAGSVDRPMFHSWCIDDCSSCIPSRSRIRCVSCNFSFLPVQISKRRDVEILMQEISQLLAVFLSWMVCRYLSWYCVRSLIISPSKNRFQPRDLLQNCSF